MAPLACQACKGLILLAQVVATAHGSSWHSFTVAASLPKTVRQWGRPAVVTPARYTHGSGES